MWHLEPALLLFVAGLLACSAGGLGFWFLITEETHEERNTVIMALGFVLGVVLLGAAIVVVSCHPCRDQNRYAVVYTLTGK